MDDISAIIMRAAARVERLRLAGGPDVAGWVPLANVPPLGMPIKPSRKRIMGARPQRGPEPLPAGHPIALEILRRSGPQ